MERVQKMEPWLSAAKMYSGGKKGEALCVVGRTQKEKKSGEKIIISWSVRGGGGGRRRGFREREVLLCCEFLIGEGGGIRAERSPRWRFGRRKGCRGDGRL